MANHNAFMYRAHLALSDTLYQNVQKSIYEIDSLMNVAKLSAGRLQNIEIKNQLLETEIEKLTPVAAKSKARWWGNRTREAVIVALVAVIIKTSL